jgi:hypothetical protein
MDPALFKVFVEEVGLDYVLMIHFFGKDIKYEQDDAHFVETPTTLKIFFQITSSLVQHTEVYIQELTFEKDRTFWRYLEDRSMSSSAFSFDYFYNHAEDKFGDAKTTLSAFDPDLTDHLVFLDKNISNVKIKHSEKRKNVTIKYDDLFNLYVRILGTVAIPLIILSFLVISLSDNLFTR